MSDKRSIKCRVPGCVKTFTYNMARMKHEKADHPDVKFPKRTLTGKSKPPSKDVVVHVSVEFCCFCGKHLPNAYVSGGPR